MINEMHDKRIHILEQLYREKGDTVSGVKLSAATGISRVAVWKHINALKKDGFAIESRPKGYFLTDPDDLMLSFCFDTPLSDRLNLWFKDRIFYFPQVSTTMDRAREMARQGSPHFTCVVAGRQTRGRGRLNRQWLSGAGGLWFTLILVPGTTTPPPLAYLYNFAASLSLSLTLETLFGLAVRVKWPNDLLLEGRKLVGLLSEIETQADMIRFLLMGIGINVNNNPASDAFQAISIRQALGRPVSRKKILVEFLRQFDAQTRDMNPAAIMGAWRKRTATIGTRVRVETHRRTVTGTALDIDDSGTLIVSDDTRKIHHIIYGDCFHS